MANINVLAVNGRELPPPDQGIGFVASMLVTADSGRDEDGYNHIVEIGDFPQWTPKWTRMTQEDFWFLYNVRHSRISVDLTFPNPGGAGRLTQRFYCGDVTGELNEYKAKNKYGQELKEARQYWTNVSVTFIKKDPE